jgi:hypothetical protein
MTNSQVYRNELLHKEKGQRQSSIVQDGCTLLNTRHTAIRWHDYDTNSQIGCVNLLISQSLVHLAFQPNANSITLSCAGTGAFLLGNPTSVISYTPGGNFVYTCPDGPR